MHSGIYKRKPLSEEHKNSISIALMGRKQSEETKKKCRENHRGFNSELTKQRISSGLKGHKHSEETKRKMSLSHKGKINANKGKKISEETKRKISKSAKGRLMSEDAKNNMKKTWNDPFLKERRIKQMLLSLKKRPLKSEKLLDYILQNNFPNEWMYVGDGSFLIGYKNPDFININGEKICIEIYYDYFKIKEYGSSEKYEEIRSSHFKKYGWNTFFIKHSELDDKTRLVAKIKLWSWHPNKGTVCESSIPSDTDAKLGDSVTESSNKLEDGGV